LVARALSSAGRPTAFPPQAAQGLTVVTGEAANAAIRRRVPIPNVCDAFGVNWINTFDMLRALGAVFR
jgi:hypothetical protein